MTQFIELKDSRQWSLSQVMTAQGKKVIKVPIAFEWKGSHPEYGEVNISPEKIDQMLSNWKTAAAGYEPSLKIGHKLPGSDRFGDEASEGWPESLYVEGDTLYGEFLPTNDQLYTDVEKRVYRYASAEIIPNAIDKTTGKEIGCVLTGVALTNEPFLPMRERTVEVIEKFSDTTPACVFTFTLDTPETTMTDLNNQTVEAPLEAETQPTESTQAFAQPTAPVVDTVAKSDFDALAQKYAMVTEQFSSMAAEQAQLKSQLDSLLQKDQEQAFAQKSAKLNSLNLPAERKEVFAELIKAGDLSETAEKNLFAQYEAESVKYGHIFKATQGETEAAPAPKAPQVFAEILERNQKILEQRQATQRF